MNSRDSAIPIVFVWALSFVNVAIASDTNCDRILYRTLPEVDRRVEKDFFLIAISDTKVKVESGDLVFAASTSCAGPEDAICLESTPFSIRIPQNLHAQSSWTHSNVKYRVTAKIENSSLLGRLFNEVFLIERLLPGAEKKIEVLSFSPTDGLLTLSTWNKRTFVLNGQFGVGASACVSAKK